MSRLKGRTRLQVAWTLAFAVVLLLLAWHRIDDNDPFWHVALGQAVASAHARVVPEPLALPDFGTVCIVREWGWDVLAFAVHRAWGWSGISALVLATAALAGAALVTLASRWSDRPRPLVHIVAVTLLAAPPIATRLNARPESLSLVLWPIGLLLARAVSRARRPLPGALALVVLAFAWAQVHLSILAFAPAAMIVLAPALLRRETRVVILLAIVALALSTLASAHGTGVLVRENLVTPYLTRHIGEWKPLEWSLFDPFESDNAQGPPYALLLAAGIAGAVVRRRRVAVEIALAVFGLAVALQGRRGISPAAILTVPLALEGIAAIARATWLRAAVVGLGLLATARMFVWTVGREGALFRTGLAEGTYPLAASRMLKSVGGSHRALTTYRSGPPLAFATNGAVRTFVDSRAPLLFSDGDLAAAGAIWSTPSALAPATVRYGFDVAVVERGYSVCLGLSQSADWHAVLVEPGFATFVRAPAPSLAKLRPCGDAYLDDASCEDPAALDAEIARLEAFAPAAFVRYLRAERALRCAKSTFDGDAIQALIPPASEASGFEAARDATEAWLLAIGGRRGEALELLAPHVAKGEAWTLPDALPYLAKGGVDRELRATLEAAITAAHDDADPRFVVALANVCARLGDLPCARLRGYDAAALARFDVAPALCFLARAEPDEARRADARRWVEALRAGAPPQIRAQIACP